MKFTAKRLFGAGVIGIAAIAAPVVLTVGLPALSSAPGSLAGAQPASPCIANATYDEVCYVQSSTSPADTWQLVKAGAPSPTTIQTANMTANVNDCATVPGAPANTWLFNICGYGYGPPNAYASSSSLAPLGIQGTATGVGAVQPPYSIEQKSNGGRITAEGIDFTAGPGTSGRPFNDAQIQITRKDSGVSSSNGTVVVQLAELNSPGGSVIATQNCSLTGSTNASITADTSGSGTAISGAAAPNCAPSTPAPLQPAPPGAQCWQPPQGSNIPPISAPNGCIPTPASFQTVEARNASPSSSISVTGTSTFTLQNQVCPGHPIQPTSGPLTGAVLSATAGCKTYTTFTSTGNADGSGQELDFGGGTGNIALTLTIPWAPQTPACQPDTSIPGQPGIPLPTCFTHQVEVNGQAFTDQVYCPNADPTTLPSGTLCTTSKTYSVQYTPTGATVTSGTGAIGTGLNSLAVTNASDLGSACVQGALEPCVEGEIAVPTTDGTATLTYTGNDQSGMLTGLTVLTGDPASTIAAGASVAQVETVVNENWIGNVDCCFVR